MILQLELHVHLPDGKNLMLRWRWPGKYVTWPFVWSCCHWYLPEDMNLNNCREILKFLQWKKYCRMGIILGNFRLWETCEWISSGLRFFKSIAKNPRSFFKAIGLNWCTMSICLPPFKLVLTCWCSSLSITHNLLGTLLVFCSLLNQYPRAFYIVYSIKSFSLQLSFVTNYCSLGFMHIIESNE